MSEQSVDYSADNITTLEGLEAVRERPAMYIGSTDQKGLHHLVYEVVDNSIDEALAGHCDTIEVTIHDDGSVSVSDNGRGIPVDDNEDGIPAVEVIMTVLHAGGKFDNDAYSVSGGLHGVGVSCVNALSEKLEVHIKRDGYHWHQTYEYANPGELVQGEELGDDEETGTEIRFWPDTEIMETIDYDYEVLRDRLQNLAYLNPGIEIVFTDERPDGEDDEEADAAARSDTFLYEGGIREFVEHLNEAKEPLHNDIMYFEGEEETDEGNQVAVEVAMQYTHATTQSDDSLLSFANNIETVQGGTHLTGFKQATTRVVNRYAQENGLLKDIEDDSLGGAFVREGLTAVISVKHSDPQFEGQTKTKLGNASVRGVVSGVLNEQLDTYLEENPETAEAIVQKAVQAVKASKAAQQAEELTRRDSPLESTGLPGKLADCQTKDPSKAELFVVEGDSAGGSAKQGRDPEYQSILPLKGKIINPEKHRLNRILQNDEVQNLLTAIGAGVGDEFDIDEARYQKIIMLTDADVDGAHIRTLLLTLLYRHMRPLVEAGYVYKARPPLYRLRYGGETIDAMTDAERDEIIEERGKPDRIQRFKGLGEMNPEQLWETTMDPDSRHLERLTVEDAAEADKMFSILMGEDVEPRREFIQENAGDVDWVDI